MLRPRKGRYHHGPHARGCFWQRTKAFEGKRALMQLDSEGSISVYGKPHAGEPNVQIDSDH